MKRSSRNGASDNVRRVVVQQAKKAKKGEAGGTPTPQKKFYGWKRAQGESVDPEAPLFLSRFNRPLSARRFRSLFKEWQERARFERFFTVHELRHTALTHLWRRTKNLRMVQKLARHSSARTTEMYTHVDDEDFLHEVRKQPC